MHRWRRRALAGGVAVIAAAAGAGVPAQAAAPRPIAKLRAYAPVSAAPGWFAWSVERREGWRLVTQRPGRKPRVQPVAASREPFDVDLGTDAAGRVVATYSRCRTRRDTEAIECRLWMLDPATGAEREPGIPTPAGASDRSPSMWMGRIAFARDLPDDRPDAEHLLLATPGQGEPRDLGTGSLTNECAGVGCPTKVDPSTGGRISRVDLGPSQAAFLWSWVGADSFGHGQQEVVVADAAGGGALVADGGFFGEKCTDGEVDTVELDSPVVHRGRVLHASWVSECYVGRSFLGRLVPETRRRFVGPVRGVVRQIASDGRRLYGLFAARPRGEVDPACTHAAPCELRPLAQPHYRQQKRPAEPPLLAPSGGAPTSARAARGSPGSGTSTSSPAVRTAVRR